MNDAIVAISIRPILVGPAKPRAVVASLFCVLLGLGFFLVAVLASDPTGF